MSGKDSNITYLNFFTINNKRMKIYQKPITDIDITPEWEEHFMAGSMLGPTGGRPDAFGGLPITGGSLRDPSFSNSG